VRPKERGEVTVVRAPDLEGGLAERHIDLGEQPLGVLHPARAHVSLSLLRQERTCPTGIKAKRLKAGWDNAYLAKGLFT